MKLGRLFFLFILVGSASLPAAGRLTACEPDGSGQTVEPARERQLMPAEAKAAILEMMHSEAGQAIAWFKGDAPQGLEQMPIRKDEDGTYAWSTFRIDPQTLTYRFRIESIREEGPCSLEYEGSLRLVNGEWKASVPELLSTAIP